MTRKQDVHAVLHTELPEGRILSPPSRFPISISVVGTGLVDCRALKKCHSLPCVSLTVLPVQDMPVKQQIPTLVVLGATAADMEANKKEL